MSERHDNAISYAYNGKVYANAEGIVKILEENLRYVKEGRPSNLPDIIPIDGIVTDDVLTSKKEID